MSIDEMRRYAALVAEGHASLDERQALLTAHRGKVAARLAELEQALSIIDAKIDYYQAWSRQKKRPAAMPSARR